MYRYESETCIERRSANSVFTFSSSLQRLKVHSSAGALLHTSQNEDDARRATCRYENHRQAQTTKQKNKTLQREIK